jgi:hypothetical protein
MKETIGKVQPKGTGHNVQGVAQDQGIRFLTQSHSKQTKRGQQE